MTRSWETAERDWLSFLRDLRRVREELWCSRSHAWFRGHSSAAYVLAPSLFRLDPPLDPGASKERDDATKAIALAEGVLASWKLDLREQTRPVKEELRRAHDAGELEATRAITARLRGLQERANARRDHAVATREAARADLRRHSLVCRGEREAFMAFHTRSARSYASSWETLAAMQHHGVPTRMLDWSENLGIALFFALSRHRRYLQTALSEPGSGSDRTEILTDYPALDLGRTPVIWVMNPYHVAERQQIWDVSLDESLDYATGFLLRSDWPFDRPVPIHAPWHGTRVGAQQGTFTVSGLDGRPLDQIFPAAIRSVALGEGAAWYATVHMAELFGLDDYLVYRDMDALGRIVRAEFLRARSK